MSLSVAIAHVARSFQPITLGASKSESEEIWSGASYFFMETSFHASWLSSRRDAMNPFSETKL
jgi:hypothetical protein